MFGEQHLRRILKSHATYHNRAAPAADTSTDGTLVVRGGFANDRTKFVVVYLDPLDEGLQICLCP